MVFGGSSRSRFTTPGTSSTYNWSVRKFFPGHPPTPFVAVLAAIAVIIAGCSGETPTATPTPVPSLTPTPSPTDTPLPTVTTAPTETPEPEAPQAPDFSLPTGTGERYTLDDLLAGREALVIVFYRSYG